ncbi:hypothetical protein ACILPE_09615 [Capnocytophaga canimorsus]|uniref:hypothetical protein n=1 Tax=Capnocytophaga canimorsus TaxID=28188 RepID=UPI0037D57149
MNLITLEESAWKAILEQLQSIRKHIEKDTSHWDELWLNQHEVCQLWHPATRNSIYPRGQKRQDAKTNYCRYD